MCLIKSPALRYQVIIKFCEFYFIIFAKPNWTQEKLQDLHYTRHLKTLILNKGVIQLLKTTISKTKNWAYQTQIQILNSDLKGAVVHWDWKLLPHILNKENAEFREKCVLISCGDEEELKGFPHLKNSIRISRKKKFIFSSCRSL